MNVTTDLILQNFISKPVFFLLTYYVPDVLIIYVYMPSSALIILLSLLLYGENSYKKAFLVEIISHWCRGKD